ncbi:hypothetical protein B0J15DRAFT_531564 [Fusarium solani]|uniref:Zn(2)-C6 fungal-type domain-containing protein n=1 Tax=Fusarium solani TaxID=169388 RepID=A0A9P9L8E2_FUSSL|nr:uncharacterized protein B0J15DRAFT_531564 [Fusarium solani]KAH7276133.1 hypothetical protein B0J15DRAFT_531564 [Fusarium solani]
MKIRKTTTCHTCRARKLACDGKRPSCSQCLFSSKKCAGYDHDLIFRPPVVSNSYPARATKSKRQRRRVSVDSQKAQSVVSKQVTLPANEFPLTRSLSWPLLDIISLVVQNFSPVGKAPQFVPSQASIFSHRICGGWVEMLPELARGSKADQCLSPAIKTLAVSILARGSQGRAPMSDALAAHTTALESLNSGLDGWATSAPNIVAASIMCLFLSEMIMPTGPTSAIVHAKGIEDLMKLQKPCFYASGISHHLFVGFRPVLTQVLQAFFSRRKHFLSDPAWTSIPFEFYIPSPLQSLFTEVFPLAEILGRIDHLSDTPADQAVASAQEIVEELLDILEKVVCRDETVREETTAHRWLPIFPVQEDLPIQFPDIIAGNFFTHLWAFQVICAHNIIKLMSRFPCLSTSTKMRSLDNLLDVKMINQLALWTFRSIEFLLKEEFKLFGAASISLPLKTACDVLKTFGADDPEMVFWFCRVSRFIKETGYYFLIQMLDDDE